MTLEFTAALASRGFDVDLAVEAGETVAVLGPNGAGKSTLLDLVAGLLRADRGHARLNGRILFDAEARGREGWRAPHERGVSLLAQDPLLFPHLSVLDNVAFGSRSRGASARDAARRAGEWLERVDAVELARRRPGELSGGQAQRVAVARALASDPDLLLLDEPMAALDAAVAPALRRMLREVLADRMAVIVTHDVLDAFTLADRVVVLEAGRVVDAGPTRAVLDRPATPFAAGLAALDLLAGVAQDDGSVAIDGGLAIDGLLRVRSRFAEHVAAGARAGVCVRPALVTIGTGDRPTQTDDTNVLPGVVTDLEPRGDIVRVHARGFAADVPPGRIAELDLAPGADVWFAFAAQDALAYPLRETAPAGR